MAAKGVVAVSMETQRRDRAKNSDREQSAMGHPPRALEAIFRNAA
jgi:hypothetical protein